LILATPMAEPLSAACEIAFTTCRYDSLARVDTVGHRFLQQDGLARRGRCNSELLV
jgi:hypothetical protein